MQSLPRFPDGEIQTFACVGAVSDRSVRVWLRDPSLTRHTAKLKTAEGQEASVELRPDSSHDGVAAADVILDQPEPDARFELTVAGMTRNGRLATARDSRASFAFGFGSCHEPLDKAADNGLERSPRAAIYEGMRKVLRERDARFLAMVGDQVYADEVPHMSILDLEQQMREGDAPDALEFYRHIYRGYYQDRGLRGLFEDVPTVMVWDDHEIMDNWGCRQDGAEKRWMFEAASTAYREYQHLHNPGTALDDEPPYAYTLWQGDVGFIALDMRSERDYDKGQVIGERQWQMLHSFLADATQRAVPTVFIIVTIPLVHFPPALVRLGAKLPVQKARDARGRWNADGFREDRARLLDALFDWQAAGEGRQAIMLSGDVHAAASFTLRRRRGPGRLTQWTSSAVSAPVDGLSRRANSLLTRFAAWGDHHCMVHREHLETANNFGVVDVRPMPDGPGHEIRFSLYAQPDRRKPPSLRFTSAARP